MSENFLSQDEIDALLGKNSKKDEFLLGEVEKDIIGEVGNISMSTAATTLSSILNQKVMITTPRVSWIQFKQIVNEMDIPKVVAGIEFKAGLDGGNMLMMDVPDAVIIADLMMGGDGRVEKKELTELELSAVAEAMNQMIGSASTAMATMFGREIDIQPPNVQLWNTINSEMPTFMKPDDYICKIAFDLNVEGLIKSEIMQIFTKDTVQKIAEIMMGDTAEVVEVPKEKEVVQKEVKEEVKAKEPEVPTEKVVVQKPVFTQLTPNSEPKTQRNLDLIMDVPLEFSVVLGKTKKTIKEVLTFNNGSVVELNKLADEPLEIYVNGKLIAHGEVVVINENFGIRITNILSKEQRVQNLK